MQNHYFHDVSPKVPRGGLPPGYNGPLEQESFPTSDEEEEEEGEEEGELEDEESGKTSLFFCFVFCFLKR